MAQAGVKLKYLKFKFHIYNFEYIIIIIKTSSLLCTGDNYKILCTPVKAKMKYLYWYSYYSLGKQVKHVSST